MPDDARSHSVTCGCNCQPETFHASEAVDNEIWAPCDCVLCGAGRCSVKVDYVAKVAWWVIKRGHFTYTRRQIEASPRYCGSCIDYHDLKHTQKTTDRVPTKNRTSEHSSDDRKSDQKRHRKTFSATGR